MIKLGEAAYDERGALAYGQPGDQTGLEVREIDLYNDVNRPWTKLFRAKDKETARKIALAMRQACANQNIGYAQYGDNKTKYKDRYGLFEALKETPSHTIPDVTIPCNVDCSSLMACCCRAAGIDVPVTVRTAIQESVLMATKAFESFPFDQSSLKEGDILWRNGHTAVITSVSTVQELNKTPKWVTFALEFCSVYLTADVGAGLLPDWPHLGRGNLVDVCDEEGMFWYVRIAGKHFGFVKKTSLKDNAPEPDEAENGFPRSGVIQTAVNLRQGPENRGAANLCNIEAPAGSKIRHILNKGETVKVIGESGNWWQVEVIGRYTWTPWIAKKSLGMDIVKFG